MTNVEIGVGSIANVLSALESIGFTIDSVNSTAKWGYDTNDKIYFKAETNSSNTLLRIYNSANAVIDGGISMTAATSMKMTYEKIGNSVVFGIMPLVTTGNSIQFMVIQPKDSDDNWLYCSLYTGTGQSANHIIDGATENAVLYPATALYNGSANGIQICKYYDGARFVGNLYETSVCASIPAGSNANASTLANNNYIEATIGSDTYLVVNHVNNIAGVKLAIKKS